MFRLILAPLDSHLVSLFFANFLKRATFDTQQKKGKKRAAQKQRKSSSFLLGSGSIFALILSFLCLLFPFFNGLTPLTSIEAGQRRKKRERSERERKNWIRIDTKMQPRSHSTLFCNLQTAIISRIYSFCLDTYMYPMYLYSTICIPEYIDMSTS